MSLSLDERILYQQIHPLKLLVDWGFGFVAIYFAWQHNLSLTWLIALVPSVLVTLYLVKFADLQKTKDSAFGRYLAGTMGRGAENVRLVGFFVMLLGAWFHLVWVIGAGLLLIVAAWTRGWFAQKFLKAK